MIYITTATGKHFNPIDPTEDMLDIRDIAHSLSLVCRANGHVRTFYSVAQHSIACYKEAQARGYTEKIQKACLLHDASEAYLSDVMRPIKGLVSEYLVVEDRLQGMIWDKYLKEPLTEEDKKKVFAIDDDMLSYEFYKLMPESISENYKQILSEPDMDFVNPAVIEEDFISCLES
jgi:hypothetical protein